MIRLPWLAALSLSCGALMALGQAPASLPAVMLAMLLGAFVLFQALPRLGQAALAGGLIGVGYFVVALFWITAPFQVDAARHGWMAPFALLLMSGGLALFWAGAFALAHWLRAGVVGLALCWPVAELLRAYVLTGFPWAMLPQAVLDTPAAQGLAWGGPHGMMFFFCAGAAFLAQFLTRPLLVLLPGMAALGLVVVPQNLPAPALSEATVRLVQPNAPQSEKWDPLRAPIFLARQLRATAAAPAVDLVIWPESAVTELVSFAGPIFAQIADASGGMPVALGAQRLTDEAYANSLVVLGDEGQVMATYDKHHLVPFGEYIPLAPLAARLGLRGLAQRMGAGFDRGPGPQVLDLGPLGKALPLICYEVVFAHDVGGAPTRPDFLMQVTNDAWFGQRAGPQQHLAQARMRAIEQGLPLARSANTGISAMIGPRGRILAQLPMGVSGHIDARLPAPLPPTLYARTGDVPIALLLALGLCLLFIRRISIDAPRGRV